MVIAAAVGAALIHIRDNHATVAVSVRKAANMQDDGTYARMKHMPTACHLKASDSQSLCMDAYRPDVCPPRVVTCVNVMRYIITLELHC